MLFEQTIPVKYKKIEVLFETKLVNTMYSLIKPFINEEIKKVITFYGNDLTGFLTKYDKKRLPTTIGGEFELQRHSEDEVLAMDRVLLDHWKKYAVFETRPSEHEAR